MNSDILVKFSFFLLVIRFFAGLFIGSTTVLTALINLLLIIALIMQNMSPKMMICLFLGALFVFYNNLALGVVDILIFAYVLRNENLNQYFRYTLLLFIAAFLIILFLVSTGYLTEHEMFINYKGDEATYAKDLGMKNPNMTSLFFFIILSFVCLHYNKVKLSIRILISFILIWISVQVYSYTLCRTAFFATIMMSVLYMCHGVLMRYRALNKFLYMSVPVVASLASLYLVLNPEQFSYLDDVATNRVAYPAMVIQQMSLLNWIIGIRLPDMAMDTSYLSILFSGGIFMFLIVFFLFYKRIRYDYDLLCGIEPVVIAVFMYGITENIFSSCNPLSVLIFSYLLYPSYRVQELNEFELYVGDKVD